MLMSHSDAKLSVVLHGAADRSGGSRILEDMELRFLLQRCPIFDGSSLGL